jgi:hypothetical protein
MHGSKLKAKRHLPWWSCIAGRIVLARMSAPLNHDLEPAHVKLLKLADCIFSATVVVVFDECVGALNQNEVRSSSITSLALVRKQAYLGFDGASAELVEFLFELGQSHIFGDVADKQTHA